MRKNLTEAAGFALVLGFLWFVWPPLVLLGAGLLLVVQANTRASSPARLGQVVGAAWIAARRAAAATREVEDPDKVRRIA
ncbi:hypothetical protein [Actinoplanes sp. N902-109]|uniref:hypothetical protein n=1 Tax=Actinoplanes sp. (strain N902-109) TaxID=649831 RepID=UPI000329341C|nr:hypothetical protein [Actinoplanes sp. N902-109]AGL19508.1 hypothetical protein L083_5998 [Actinoplanes sp. N902-109]